MKNQDFLFNHSIVIDLTELVSDQMKGRVFERWQIQEAEGVSESVRLETVKKIMRGEN